MTHPTHPRLGLWLIGARGGVAVTTLAGLAAKRLDLADDVGLVTQLRQFAGLDLPAWSDWVVGGHDIRGDRLVGELERLHRDNRVLSPELVAACRPVFDEIEPRLRPGVLWNVGSRIAELADRPASDAAAADRTARAAVERIQTDLREFRDAYRLETVVVVNLASTEPFADLDMGGWGERPRSPQAPPAEAGGSPTRPQPPTGWAELESTLDREDCPLPASSLYAIAALDLGMPYVNFTPSLGATLPAVDELARLRGTCHAGRDAKTGETLLKSVLAPMFAARNLEVMSWVGHNIFGNLDGKVLDDPRNKSAKLKSKDRAVADVLGYAPQTLISIEHVASLGDWKTAWDHIHFRGFLGTPMTLQFTWQGCDSLLAAPLVLDLARLTAVAQNRGETGVISAFSSFFKSPLGEAPPAFADQVRQLEAWALR